MARTVVQAHNRIDTIEPKITKLETENGVGNEKQMDMDRVSTGNIHCHNILWGR